LHQYNQEQPWAVLILLADKAVLGSLIYFLGHFTFRLSE